MIFIHINASLSNLKNMLNTILPKLHKEGYRFLAIAIVITFAMFAYFKNIRNNYNLINTCLGVLFF